eukprot:1021216-Amphidinium_carterae.1
MIPAQPSRAHPAHTESATARLSLWRMRPPSMRAAELRKSQHGALGHAPPDPRECGRKRQAMEARMLAPACSRHLCGSQV